MPEIVQTGVLCYTVLLVTQTVVSYPPPLADP